VNAERFSRRDVLGGLAAGACLALPFASRPADAQELPKLRVAYLPFAYSAQALYAQELGFFT
jgi:ABC-type nitrate/sulfonate/bicarbonate transport system substrate-binding protein